MIYCVLAKSYSMAMLFYSVQERILICSNLREAVENAEFVFEAASERINIKRALLKGTYWTRLC